MRTFFTQLTTLRTPYSDPSEQQQANRLLLINLIWITATILAAPLMLWWLAGLPDINTGLLLVPLTVFSAFVIHGFIQRGHLRWARRLFVANLMLVALLSTFPEYRLDSPFIILFTLPLTAGGVLLRRSRLLVIALALVVAVSIGGLAQIETGMEPTTLGSATQSIGASIALVFVVIGLNTAILWVFINSTEESIEERHRLARSLADMLQVSHTLSDLSAVGDELNRVVEQLRDGWRLYHVQIFLADPNSGAPILQASTGFIGRRLLDEDSLLRPEESSPISNTLRRRDPLLIRETDPAPQRAGFLPATRSEFLLPLRVGNLMPFGVLDLHSADPDAFLPEERHMLITISHHLAAAIHNIRQANDLRTEFAERDRLIAQYEAGQREIARLNRQLVGSTWGEYLQERQGIAPQLGWRDGAIVPAESESEALALTVDDGQPRLEQRDDASILCVPIRLRNQTLGAVEFRRSGSMGWTSAALELAQVVAERLALSLENARLFEQAQTTAQREQLVGQITSQLQTTTDLQSLLTLAAARFQDALGASHTRVRLGPPTEDKQG